MSISHLLTGIPLIAWVFFSLTCMNKMKQSRGININAVITALRATQNQDNSRRLASRKKKKILITLASAFFTNGRHAAACHLKMYRLICVAVHSSFAPSFTLQIEGQGQNLAEWCVCEGCNEIDIFCNVFYVPWLSSVKVQFFSRNPSCSLELLC